MATAFEFLTQYEQEDDSIEQGFIFLFILCKKIRPCKSHNSHSIHQAQTCICSFLSTMVCSFLSTMV